MKPVNLISFTQSSKELTPETFNKYLKHHSSKIKKKEISDLNLLVDSLNCCFIGDYKLIYDKISLFENYFIGYEIPQISKQFDLLRIGSEDIINIELKSKDTGEKIKEQLIQNKYYLKFLDKKVHNFTFVADDKKLYALDDSKNLVKTDFYELLSILCNKKSLKIDNINLLFNPSNYLISPFNSTKKFIEGKYFLTTHQKAIKVSILKALNKGGAILSIKGGAGTGKTLLTYDIVKEFMLSKDKTVLVVHCGYLNEGHVKLQNEYGWNIIEIRDFKNNNISYNDLNKYSLIVIDEVQRIYPNQLNEIIKNVKKNYLNCIFSYDRQQCLTDQEITNNIEAKIEEKTTSRPYELTDKIRTNKEIAIFIRALFEKNFQYEKLNFSNIEVNYFTKFPDVRKFLRMKKEEKWKIINYTPSRRQNLTYDNYNLIETEEDNAHTVIGQEYDNVVAVIDKHFFYDGNNLSIKDYLESPFYSIERMLYQILTRARRKLSIIILNNKEMLNRCISILDYDLVNKTKEKEITH